VFIEPERAEATLHSKDKIISFLVPLKGRSSGQPLTKAFKGCNHGFFCDRGCEPHAGTIAAAVKICCDNEFAVAEGVTFRDPCARARGELELAGSPQTCDAIGIRMGEKFTDGVRTYRPERELNPCPASKILAALMNAPQPVSVHLKVATRPVKQRLYSRGEIGGSIIWSTHRDIAFIEKSRNCAGCRRWLAEKHSRQPWVYREAQHLFTYCGEAVVVDCSKSVKQVAGGLH